MPRDVKPMLAVSIDEPFDDKDWIYEIKWDGYRAVAEIKDGSVNLHSRNNLSFNTKFKPVADALKAFTHNAVLDGEIVIVDKDGKSSFQALQNYQKTGEGNIQYYIFDILYLDGYDLTGLPLLKRKEILKEVLPEIPYINYSDHITEHGISFFEAAQKQGLEGIIAKDSSSPYRTARRSREWLKIKTQMRQEAVIGGFTEPKGSRKAMGALVLGVYNDKGGLEYIGHTGGGFDDEGLKQMRKRLEPLAVKTSPFKKKPKTNSKVTWVKPEYICEVTFSEWTDSGTMRHPIFVGMREDKDPQDVRREKIIPILKAKEIPMAKVLSKTTSKKVKEKKVEAKKTASKSSSSHGDKEVKINGHTLKLSNLNKVYFPDEGYTKGDVIDYYRKIHKYMLPYLKGRPESLNRHPNGINHDSFFQKNVGDTVPEWVETQKVFSESNNEDIHYMICNDEATLIYMANLGCIEINPWFSTVKNLANPDYMVIDLDPEDISFEKVVETALVVKEVLDEAGAKSFCKTSGATGLHIYIPLKAKYDYDISKEFGHLIAEIVNGRLPDFTSIERSPSKRQKKVYLDYLQNRKGQTLAAPYSLRPKPGATVATPLEWKEVKKGLDPGDFNIKTIHSRLKKKGDIFKGIFGSAVNIEKCITRLEKL